MPVKVIYDQKGDLRREDELRGYALTQLFVTKDMMKFNDLKQDQRRINLIDGSVITIKSCYGDDVVTIFSPKQEAFENFGYERFFASARVGVYRHTTYDLIASACTIWDCHNDKQAVTGFSMPAPYVGATDAAQWEFHHFNLIYLSPSQYTVDENENTITCNDVDFTMLNAYGPCVKPGDFVYYWGRTERTYTRVTDVSAHTLRVGNVTRLNNGGYPTIEISCSIRMFTYRSWDGLLGGDAMNGCGGSELILPLDTSARPMVTGDWSFTNDSFQMQTHHSYGNLAMGQCNKLDRSARGFFTPYNYNSSPGFTAAIQEMVSYCYAAAGEEGVNKYGYATSDLFRYNEQVDG
jgi:hypothetical protein